ncbi:MAG: NfeD family protein [Sulfolobales archaeon]
MYYQLGKPLPVVVLLLVILTLTIGFEATTTGSTALVVEIKPPWDTIDPGIAECVIEALDLAESSTSVLILAVDSYGGWLDSALAIGDAIYSSKIPVIGYVAGGKALSAGTLILLPSHIIALSQNSIVGAMQPVSYDPLTGSVRYLNESKVLNPIIEKAVLYAESRGRNVSLVKEFIVGNLVLNAQEALKLGLSDLIANDIADLIAKVNGVEVTIASKKYVLNIEGYRYYSCSLRSRTLSLLSNTLVSTVLFSVGIMALIFSIASANLYAVPLALVFLILGLIGSGFNPNLASLIMITLGSMLLMLELLVIPGFGATGIAGIAFLVFGFLLMPTSLPVTTVLTPEQLAMFRVAAIALGLLGGSITTLIFVKLVKIRKMKKQLFSLEGKVGKAVDRLTPNSYGYVFVEGEYWLAKSEDIVEPGERVYVVKHMDTYLLVRKYVS